MICVPPSSTVSAQRRRMSSRSRVQPLAVSFGGGVEGAELARRDAHVGVVDVPLDDVRRDVLGARVPAAAYGVGGGAQRVQRGVAVEVERLLGGDPPTLGGTVEDGLEVGLLGHRAVPFDKGVDGPPSSVTPSQPPPGHAGGRQAAYARSAARRTRPRSERPERDRRLAPGRRATTSASRTACRQNPAKVPSTTVGQPYQPRTAPSRARASRRRSPCRRG